MQLSTSMMDPRVERVLNTFGKLVAGSGGTLKFLSSSADTLAGFYVQSGRGIESSDSESAG